MSKLVFFGNERIATGVETTAPTLQALIAAGYEIAAVVVAQEPAAKSRKSRPLEVAAVAEAHAIPVLSPTKLSEITDSLQSYGADAGVLVAFGKLVPQSVIDLFQKGIVNIHPSLLPAHRGSIPIEAALLAGDPETGVSLMQLVREMDAGPTYVQATVALRGDETKQELADNLLTLGKDLLLKNLPAILDGSLAPTPQPEATVSYDQRLAKDAGLLVHDSWDRPAYEIERMVRALAGWPRVKTVVAGIDIIITQAHTVTTDGLPGTIWLADGCFGIHAKDSVLVIDRLIPAGKKEMSGSDFLRGYPIIVTT
ncbi:MAG: methionyl-tRNA formyltransferase [Patescibacteria group bacterium]|nr:methionyl-tRNA formyltransferase [Patescibacteria group bacterium]